MLGGGLQGVNYTSFDGESKIKHGGKIGIGYTHFLSKHFGLVSGAELGIFGNDITLNDQIFATGQVDSERDAFEYRVRTEGYAEQFRFKTLSVPLMLQFRAGNNVGFFINAGGKIMLPFRERTSANARAMHLTGYYPDMNVEYTNLPQHGFGTINSWSSNKNLLLNPVFAATAETGASFRISLRSRLYTGFYVDYGLTDLRRSNSQITDIPLVSYSPKGINHAQINGFTTMTNGSSKANLFAVGFQLRWAFQERDLP